MVDEEDAGTQVTLCGGKLRKAEFDRGWQEFSDFVLATWEGYVDLERRQLGHETGLSLFCRLDIGVNRSGYFSVEVCSLPLCRRMT